MLRVAGGAFYSKSFASGLETGHLGCWSSSSEGETPQAAANSTWGLPRGQVAVHETVSTSAKMSTSATLCPVRRQRSVAVPPAQPTDYLISLFVGLLVVGACAVTLSDQTSRVGRVVWRWFTWKRTPTTARSNLVVMVLFGVLLCLVGIVGLISAV